MPSLSQNEVLRKEHALPAHDGIITIYHLQRIAEILLWLFYPQKIVLTQIRTNYRKCIPQSASFTDAMASSATQRNKCVTHPLRDSDSIISSLGQKRNNEITVSIQFLLSPIKPQSVQNFPTSRSSPGSSENSLGCCLKKQHPFDMWLLQGQLPWSV